MTQNQRADTVFNNLNRNEINRLNKTNQLQTYRVSPVQSFQLKAILYNSNIVETKKFLVEEANQSESQTSYLLNTTNKIFLNDYILIESNCSNDPYGMAFHTVKRQYYNWKRFDKKDYMKKLENYLIMEGSINIYKYVELIIDLNDQYVYTFFEKHHGDLYTHLREKKHLDETEARFLFQQCVEVINECHSNGIIVRDIKLKRFVFLDEEKTKLGLTNLEDCIILDEDATDDLIQSQQGCPAYVSPEVLNSQRKSYSGMLCDSWSLGIVLFTLLIGRYPFQHQIIPTMLAKITNGKFQIPPSSGLSLNAKILLRSLIRVKPEERLLPSEILAHNWFKDKIINRSMINNRKIEVCNYSTHVSSISQAVNYLNNLNSNTTSELNSNTSFQRKPLEATLSAPVSSTVSITDSRSQKKYIY